jgi:hypothetical protein
MAFESDFSGPPDIRSGFTPDIFNQNRQACAGPCQEETDPLIC